MSRGRASEQSLQILPADWARNARAPVRQTPRLGRARDTGGLERPASLGDDVGHSRQHARVRVQDRAGYRLYLLCAGRAPPCRADCVMMDCELLVSCQLMIDGFYSQNGRGQNLSAQDKRGALAISSSLPEGGMWIL